MIRKNTKEISRDIKSCSDNGVNILDYIGEQATYDDFAQVKAMLKVNFGIDYPDEKFQLLFSLMQEEGWSKERLYKTTKWFLQNKRYPNWTISDWFDYAVKLYPYSKYCKEMDKNGKSLNDQIEWYKINGIALWKYKDGYELPFEKIK
ncbi:hypothetical protein ACFLS9_03870 [Bacteroidota bacterium]